MRVGARQRSHITDTKLTEEDILFDLGTEPVSSGEYHQQVASQMRWAVRWAIGGLLCLLIGICSIIKAPRASASANEDFLGAAGGVGIVFELTLLCVAACLAEYWHTYINLARRELVTKRHWAWFCISTKVRPLTDFSSVVVRHLCIPDGEGPDTYTGCVGLKPVDGKAVHWVRHFPAAPDESPRMLRCLRKSWWSRRGCRVRPRLLCSQRPPPFKRRDAKRVDPI